MTLANDGDRVSGTLAPDPATARSPTREVTDQDGHTIKGGDNDIDAHPVHRPESAANEAKSILETVVSSGTGVHANIGARASGARPARPRTTATPGSAARPKK